MENNNTNKNIPGNYRSAEAYLDAIREEIWSELTNLNFCWEELYDTEEEYLSEKAKAKARLDRLTAFFEQEKQRLGLTDEGVF